MPKYLGETKTDTIVQQVNHQGESVNLVFKGKKSTKPSLVVIYLL